MSNYTFVTIWCLEAPLELVWNAIVAVERWPEWWRGVERVETLLVGGPGGLGAMHRYTWKSALPYRLSFDMYVTRISPPYLLEGLASGELEGSGQWRLSNDGTTTTARYDWHVRTTKPWMNVIAPLARPFFVWNHHVVMTWGGEGLAKLLNARLLSAEEYSVPG